ncbi:hypothetical protein ACQF4J_47650 (plasmid) [Streptomyces sp. C1-1]|uniref:hypothetical protein n=1 Tax=Streptomyces sp. C1-1 TaxID=3231173 RepID=UPI003CFD328C
MSALRNPDGLKVPGDMALVSFDDFEWANLFPPRLTAMAQAACPRRTGRLWPCPGSPPLRCRRARPPSTPLRAPPILRLPPPDSTP